MKKKNERMADRLFAAIRKIDKQGNRPAVPVGATVERKGKRGVVVRKVLGAVNLVRWGDGTKETFPNYELTVI